MGFTTDVPVKVQRMFSGREGPVLKDIAQYFPASGAVIAVFNQGDDNAQVVLTYLERPITVWGTLIVFDQLAVVAVEYCAIAGHVITCDDSWDSQRPNSKQERYEWILQLPNGDYVPGFFVRLPWGIREGFNSYLKFLREKIASFTDGSTRFADLWEAIQTD